jgi:hypothetical protein
MMVIFVVLTVYETMKFFLCGCCRRPKSSIGKAWSLVVGANGHKFEEFV